MQQYLWEGKNKKGKKTKGIITAKTIGHARLSLNKKGIRVLRIKKTSTNIKKGISFFKHPVREKDLIIFFRQLSAMINAGLPLLESLEFLESQHGPPGFQPVLESIKTSVESGESFTNALKNHPQIFKNLYIHMADAGETTGTLDEILDRLAEHIQKMASLKKKIKNAMLYPAFTLIVAGGVTLLLLIFVIPVFEQMFEDMGTGLPYSTAAVISMSNFVSKHLWYIMGIFLSLVIALKYSYKTKIGRITNDYLVLKIPILGSIILQMAVARFARTASSLLTSGVPIMEMLNIAAGTSGNIIIEKGIMKVKSGISEGEYMAALLERTNLFPPMACSMIATGESTGSLEKMMNKIADFYDTEVDEALKNLTEMMEPVMLVFLGIIIGFMVISMYLPIFTMTGSML